MSDEESPIQTLEDIQSRIDECDKGGISAPLAPGVCFSVCKRGENNYNIGTIEAISNTEITFRNTAGSLQSASFLVFLSWFEKFDAKRIIPAPSNPKEFLRAKKSDYEEIEFDENDKLFVHSKNRTKDKPTPIKYFI